MTITVVSIDQGPFTATGLAQTVAYTFMTLTDEEISVFYDAGDGRVLIDPAAHVVTRNKNMDSSAKEGGTVELAVDAAPAGSSIYLRANPRADRDLVWSDTGSRLKNLNEEQDRMILRLLVTNDTLSRNIDGMAEAGSAAGALAGATAGTAAANMVVAGKADVDFDNVSSSDYSSKAFPIPLGGGNQAPVPVDIKTRWSNYASFEDFGIRLYEDDGVTVRDNTTRVQEAIDKIQPYNGVLFAPPNRDGSTVVVTGPVSLRTGTIGGKNYTGAGMAVVGIGPGDRASWQHGRYDLGQGFKLKAGSTGALITSPVGAGQLTLENLMLSGDAQNQKGIHLVDNPGGNEDYGFGGFFKQVYVNGFLGGGVYLGANRGRGATEWLWVEHSGTAGGAAALFQGSADWEHVGIGVGVNNGPGIYVGAVSQVRFFGGASWMNEVAAVISEDCLDVDFFGVHFDNSQKNNIDVRGYTGGGSGRRGGRRFFGCRTSDASQLAANTYSSIILRANAADTQFVGHDFMGGFSGGVLPKYAVETEAGAIFWADAFPVSTDSNKPYATAFTNDWTRVRIGGWDAAGLGVGNGGQSLIARADGAAVAEFRQNDAYLGGPAGQQALRANRLSGGSYNRVLVQSTSSGFDFAQIKADSDGANCDLAIAGKGTGLLRFGAHTAGAVTADGYIRIKLSDGSFARLLVDKE